VSLSSAKLSAQQEIGYQPVITFLSSMERNSLKSRYAYQYGLIHLQEVGLPAIPCIFCSYSDSIEFDPVLHHLERHKPELFKLSIGKGSIQYKTEYAINLARQKLMEAYEKDEFEEEGTSNVSSTDNYTDNDL
jgi:hypothetical protein